MYKKTQYVIFILCGFIFLTFYLGVVVSERGKNNSMAVGWIASCLWDLSYFWSAGVLWNLSYNRCLFYLSEY